MGVTCGFVAPFPFLFERWRSGSPTEVLSTACCCCCCCYCSARFFPYTCHLRVPSPPQVVVGVLSLAFSEISTGTGMLFLLRKRVIRVECRAIGPLGKHFGKPYVGHAPHKDLLPLAVRARHRIENNSLHFLLSSTLHRLLLKILRRTCIPLFERSALPIYDPAELHFLLECLRCLDLHF